MPLLPPATSPPPQEKYPRQLYVDFKKLKLATLRKYAEVFDVSVRPELSNAEMSIAVAKCVVGIPPAEIAQLGGSGRGKSRPLQQCIPLP